MGKKIMSSLFAPPPPVNPLDGYKATWDLFYEFVKLELKKPGTIETTDFIQLKVMAELLDASNSYLWFSYFSYLNKVDLVIEPVPLSQQISISGSLLSDEYGRFVDDAISLVDEQTLDETTLSKIAELNIEKANIQKEIRRLTKEDLEFWKEVAEARGISVGDATAYAQWTKSEGNGDAIGALIKRKKEIDGTLARLHSKRWKDADEKNIKIAYDAFVLESNRMRYPRRPDNEYPNGKDFSLPYLTNVISPGDTALFADRHVIFPNMSMETITKGTAGHLSVSITSDSKATESSSSDWSRGGSVSYSWFSLSGSASSNTTIKEEFKKTTKIELSWESLQIIPVDNDSWFKKDLFKNKKIQENPKLFERYFGATGTLLYYPKALIVMRGFKAKFTASQKWRSYSQIWCIENQAAFCF
jgi:hypothetical protein